MNENPTKQVFDIHVKKKNQLIEKKNPIMVIQKSKTIYGFKFL